ncbi:hypothetical protein FBU59_003027 [Linderina macrospora]|uniref:Uncharacterized protein n=1 Tax=Linderina macrospora TaxID=4868 RepID=A0ACC1J9T9_9FUNG|nr:hypothetical protein FBU59_003027 [Linderina macrospora]
MRESSGNGVGSQNVPNSSTDGAGSLESLLLNLADNEQQVQQQRIQSQIPRQPTRMKLLYEDHTQPGQPARSASSMTQYQNPVSLPQRQQPVQNSPAPPQQHQFPMAQIGLWQVPRASSQMSTIQSGSEFDASFESMREAAVRAEEAGSHNRPSSSLLHGPRSMPMAESPRARADSSLRSEDDAYRAAYAVPPPPHQDGYGQTMQASYASMYSHSGTANSIDAPSASMVSPAAASPSSGFLEPCGDSRVDKIPSPAEDTPRGKRHEAEYLFEDSDDERPQAMLSPTSEGSNKFSSYVSTSSTGSAETTQSKRLPMIPASKNSSVVSDLSVSGGDREENSMLHRSWFSSTDSVNLVGGGGLRAAADRSESESYKPKATKNKARNRPNAGSVRLAQTSAEKPSAAHEALYNGNYDTRYDLASDFQRQMNFSTDTPTLSDTNDLHRSQSTIQSVAYSQSTVTSIPPPQQLQQPSLPVPPGPVSQMQQMQQQQPQQQPYPPY